MKYGCTPKELQLEINLLRGRSSSRKTHIRTEHDSEVHNSIKYLFIQDERTVYVIWLFFICIWAEMAQVGATISLNVLNIA